MSPRVRVLFVCLGNICRSPVAEGVLRHRLRERGLERVVQVSSAGLGDWHVGELPDQRSRNVAQRNGVTLESRARVVDADELLVTEWIVCMDQQNRRALEQLGVPRERVHLLKAFNGSTPDAEVDDPYQHGPDAFERMFHEISECVDGLIDRLVQEHGLRPAPDGTSAHGS